MISSIVSSSLPATPSTKQPKPATPPVSVQPPASDRDGDGDSDRGGVDVKG